MKMNPFRVTAAAAAAFGLWSTLAMADTNQVAFPADFERGVHYGTVNRGNIREELYVNRAAIDAAKQGRPMPTGTVVTLVDYRDGALFRYVVMEKRAGWGADYAPDKRNGEWEFQAFKADRSVNAAENLDRCFSCHKSQANQDFVWSLDRMKQVP